MRCGVVSSSFRAGCATNISKPVGVEMAHEFGAPCLCAHFDAHSFFSPQLLDQSGVKRDWMAVDNQVASVWCALQLEAA